MSSLEMMAMASGWFSFRPRAAELGLDAWAALEAIAGLDLLTLGPTGEVEQVYPFSGSPTAHAVWIGNNSQPVYAMCALDALGIPFMLDQAATIQSRDPISGEEIQIAVDTNGSVTCRPESAVVLLGAAQESGSIATTCCPIINFFASDQNSRRYLGEHSEVRGTVLTIPDSVLAGRIVFEGVLRD
jgi:hypothetical protein